MKRLFLILGCLWLPFVLHAEEPDGDSAEAETEEASAEAPLADIPTSPVEGPLERFRPLLENSPFLTPEFRQRLARTQQAGARGLVFQGYVRLDGEWLVCLHDRSSNESRWLRVGETFRGNKVESFARARGELVVSSQGVTSRLRLD